AAQLQVVECELNTECNRACSYCPQSLGYIAPTNVQSLLGADVLDALLTDLARIEFGGRFSHHFYGEPLLHPDLTGIVRRVRAALPRATQILFTNGDLLTDERHEELLAAGI